MLRVLLGLFGTQYRVDALLCIPKTGRMWKDSAVRMAMAPSSQLARRNVPGARRHVRAIQGYESVGYLTDLAFVRRDVYPMARVRDTTPVVLPNLLERARVRETLCGI